MGHSIALRRVARAGVLALVLGAAIVVASGRPAVAQDTSVAARYPAAAGVAADYPDDAERYMAFKVLWDDLGAKTAGGGFPGAYDKGVTYFRGFGDVNAEYMVMRKDSSEYVAWSTHLEKLFNDAAFKRSVLEKYRVADIPLPRAAAQPVSGDVTDEMIQAAFLRALPFALAALAAMAIAARVLLRNSAGSPSGKSDPLPPPAGVPAMPESLRVVTLPGVEYDVETSSGVVIEKETTVATTFHTTTTSGEAYQVGNQIHFTPGQTSTSASSVQTDLIWVRTTEGREEPWSFTGGSFKARKGQVITLIARRLRDGSPDRMYAYNHATDQLERFVGAGNANATSTRAAWWASWAVGSVGFGIGFAVILSIAPEPIAFPMNWVTAWIEGAVASAIAAFVVTGLMNRGVMRRRNARYDGHYAPGFRRYLEECTPALEARFAAA